MSYIPDERRHQLWQRAERTRVVLATLREVSEAVRAARAQDAADPAAARRRILVSVRIDGREHQRAIPH